MARQRLSARKGGTVLPLDSAPNDLGELLRPHAEAAAMEMLGEIRRQVPEYAQPADSTYAQRVQQTIEVTVDHFVGSVGRTETSWDALSDHYARLGAQEARRGRSLDRLQTAMRLSSQVACRRFIKDAYRLGWPGPTLALLTDSLFILLEKTAHAAAQGYASAQGRIVTEREERRHRIRDLLVADPPTSREALVDLAREADWDPPGTIGVVALRRPIRNAAHLLPPGVLADWHGPVPYLIVPDPDGPGQDRLLAALAREHQSALGPTVPLARGAVSLRWATRAIELMDRGVIPSDSKGMVRCSDQLVSLMTSSCEDLLESTSATLLAPLLKLPWQRRELLATTLLAYLETAENAVLAGERLHVHQQTVRYRLRQLQQTCGHDLIRADTRLDLMIALRHLLRFSRRPSVSR